MNNGSAFLCSLIGKPVRIVVADLPSLPPQTLREVSAYGIVAEDERPRFYPWSEIVEISPGEDDAAARELEAAIGIEAEPYLRWSSPGSRRPPAGSSR